MKKMNNKGFMLAETLIVATFSMTVLVLLFVYFKDLVTTYNANYRYNTVEGIYNADTIKKYLIQNNRLSYLNTQANNGAYVILTTSNAPGDTTAYNNLINAIDAKTILYTNSNLTSLRNKIENSNPSDISNGMKEFIGKLDDVDHKHRLIIEYNNGDFATITFGYAS